MLSQAFSPENFRRIFDIENRRGVNLAGEFFLTVEDAISQIKDCMSEIRSLKARKRNLSPEVYALEKAALNEKKLTLEAKKEELLTEALKTMSLQAADRDFRVQLRRVKLRDGKVAFRLDKTPTAYFVVKQLQHNFRRLYKVKQSSRYEILCQLKGILGDSFPKYVIRTDFEDFYESIPSEVLLKKLDKDFLLTLPSRRMCQGIVRDYQRLARRVKGVPRGIGISAYLAELYVRKFDEAVRAHDDLIFYARYVDDIVIVFSPSPNSSVSDLLPFVESEAKKLGLRLNKPKTAGYNVGGPRTFDMEYLGYKITFGDGKVRMGLSKKRLDKYRARLERSFEAYKNRAEFDEKRARRLLLKRIQFLTGNTRLSNNKDRIMTGVFYSNSLLSDTHDLESLDRILHAHVMGLGAESLRQRLAGYSFEAGFSDRSYQSFTPNDFGQIVEIWKYEA